MANILTQITNYLLNQSWQIAVLAGVIAIVSVAVRNKSAHVRYLLWLIVLARCFVPPLHTVTLAILPQQRQAEPVAGSVAPTRVVGVEAVETGGAERAVVPSWPVIKPSQPTIAERLARVTVRQWFALGWIIGATVFVLCVVIKALRTNHWLKARRRRLPAELQSGIEKLFAELGVRTYPKVWLVAGIGQPFVWGLVRGSIYLPDNFSRLDSRENRRDVLGHELSHVMRFDAAVNLLQIIAQGIFWFHPFVWWANKKIRAEREKCCDEMAIARLCAKPKDYSSAIVSTLIAEYESARPVPSLAVAGPVKNIEDRIKTIMKSGKKFYRRPTFVSFVTVLLLAALAVPTTLALTRQAAEKGDDIERAVIEGIRANRDKFECGVLAWSKKSIDNSDRYYDSNQPPKVRTGQYELWWEGKKIANKYTYDADFTDPTGRKWVEKRQGGNSYDGSLLSRKPRFDGPENWLGPSVTRWGGEGSHDWMILQENKLEDIRKDWSVVDANGTKLIRLITKNMKETDQDYGAYSVRYYDPSKGHGLVNEEWYNPDGSARMKHTVKLQEMIPGGWFPVLVDYKSFAITDGRAYVHQHYALDVERCSFNDRSALPEGIFTWTLEKQLKEQEKHARKLQKYLAMELDGISVVKEIERTDQVKRGAREAIETFLAAAVAGDFEKAKEFIHPDKLPADHINDVYEAAEGQKLWIMAVVADDWSAIAVSSVVQGDHSRVGPLVFYLDRVVVDGRDNWWVHDIDMVTPDRAERDLKQFLKKHPQAKRVPESLWGKATEGVQCRLRADKLIWQGGQTPTFKADIRNGGKAHLRVLPTHQRCDLILDGKHHYWPTWEWVEQQAFPPGKVYRDIPISLVKTWAGGMPLELNPGQHKVSVSFQCQGIGSEGETVVVNVESNTVEIEILPDEGEMKSRAESADKSKGGMARYPGSRAVHRQLDEVVDLSRWRPEMSLGEALEELKNSVKPALNIVVLWRDLEENAGIDRDTLIRIDPISAVRLGTALELLLRSVSAGAAQLGYVVKDGVIVIATKESLPSNMETRVYDIYGFGQPAGFYARRGDAEEIQGGPVGEEDTLGMLTRAPMSGAYAGGEDADYADEQGRSEALNVVQTFLDAVKAKDYETAAKLVTPQSTVMDQLAQFEQLKGFEDLTVSVPTGRSGGCGSKEGFVFVQSSEVKNNGGKTGQLAFFLRMSMGRWLISNVRTMGFRLKMPPGVQEYCEEASARLRELGKLVQAYVQDHEGRLPLSLWYLREYGLSKERRRWFARHFQYVGKGKNAHEAKPDEIIIAYDTHLIDQSYNTPILFLDGHVEIRLPLMPEEIEAGSTPISGPSVTIESRFLFVRPEADKIVDFLERQCVETAPIDTEPQSTCYILDSNRVNQLLELTQAYPHSWVLTAPKVTVLDGETTAFMVEGAVDHEIMFQLLIPTIAPDGKHIILELDLEVSNTIGFGKLVHEEERASEISEALVVGIYANFSVPNGGTALISTKKVQIQDKDGRIEEKDLLVLVKAEKVEPGKT